MSESERNFKTFSSPKPSPNCLYRIGSLVVEGGVGGAVAQVVGGDGFANVSGGGGGVGVADAHFEGLGEAAPEECSEDVQKR